MSSPHTPFPAPWWVHFSDLKEIAISPKRYAASVMRTGRKSSPAFRLGSAFHYHVLGGPHEPPVWIGRKSGKDWDDFQARTGLDVDEVLSEKEDETARAMAEALRRHPIAHALVYSDGAIHEGAREWEGVNGRPCAGRIDVIGQGARAQSLGISVPQRYVVEVKSAAEFGAHAEKFKRSAMGYSYHCQGAWYGDGAEAERVFFVVVEKLEPFDVACFELAPKLIEFGRKTNHLWMDKLLRHERAGKWPGIAEGMILDFDAPEEGEALEWDDTNEGENAS